MLALSRQQIILVTSTMAFQTNLLEISSYEEWLEEFNMMPLYEIRYTGQ